MADYAPPAGPPPPQVPPGWKVIWNEQYKEWFYVNTLTKQSQWNKPDAPAQAAGSSATDDGPPPYDTSTKPNAGGHEKSGLHDVKTGLHDTGRVPEGDEELARRLQEEENARAAHSTAPGQAADYYNAGASTQQGQAQYQQDQYQQQQAQGQGPQSGEQRGLFGKLMGKVGGSSSRPPQQQQYYGQQQGYPQQGYGGYPQQGYGYPPQGYPPQQGYYAQQPPRKSGMGVGGAAALGVGGGLLGGALIGEALADHGDGGDGGDYGGDGGGDYGGDGGGDFGGGGGDFGGGGF